MMKPIILTRGPGALSKCHGEGAKRPKQSDKTDEGEEMKQTALEAVVSLAQKLGYLLVATSAPRGLPHVAVAAKIALGEGKGRVAVETWFCPGTMANLDKNPLLSLVIWDPKTDQGHQLLGRVEKVEDLILLDGYTSQPQGRGGWPQAERRLSIQVEKTLRFQRARHSDEEE